MKYGPKQTRSSILLDEVQLRRVRGFIGRVGPDRAEALLRTGPATLLAAREGGPMRPDTLRRILEEIERQEALLDASAIRASGGGQ